jgi:hypothetical protein
VLPRVTWLGLYKAGDVTNWCQRMRDCSGVVSLGLRVARGTLQIGIRASVQH